MSSPASMAGRAGEQGDGLGGAAVVAEGAEPRVRGDNVAVHAVGDAAAAADRADQVVPGVGDLAGDVGGITRAVLPATIVFVRFSVPPLVL